MSSLAWIALSISLINWIFIKSNAFVMLVAGIFAVIYSVYILYDTQLIIGGKNK
jgi:FtsH-binding integral membrane protein